MEINVYPARSKVECLEKFGSIAIAMSVAHATMLRRALDASDEATRERALADARLNLEAQMQLAQIELFVHNLPDAPRT